MGGSKETRKPEACEGESEGEVKMTSSTRPHDPVVSGTAGLAMARRKCRYATPDHVALA